MRRTTNLKQKLNLNYLDLTNRAPKSTYWDLPAITCTTPITPDYLALHTEPASFRRTPHTAICFFTYDNTFDGIDGLHNAIYYNDTNRLDYYRTRFRNAKFFIMPDYSLLGDIDAAENLHRIHKMRIVALWLTFELHAVVIPLVSFPTVAWLDLILDGYKDCTTVAFSTKGYLQDPAETSELTTAVRMTVDTLKHLKTIVVYDICENSSKTREIFRYATDSDITVVIPPNSLQLSHKTRRNRKDRLHPRQLAAARSSYLGARSRSEQSAIRNHLKFMGRKIQIPYSRSRSQRKYPKRHRRLSNRQQRLPS